MKTVAIFFALALMGCAADVEEDSTRNFRADETFTIAEQIEIRDYLSQLSVKTGQYIGITFDYPHPKQDVSFSGDELDSAKVMIRTVGTGGLWTSKHRTIRIGTGEGTYSPKRVALLAAHEMGHDIGLKHIVTDGHALMCHNLEGEDFRWTEADQKECERVDVCKKGSQ